MCRPSIEKGPKNDRPLVTIADWSQRFGEIEIAWTLCGRVAMGREVNGSIGSVHAPEVCAQADSDLVGMESLSNWKRMRRLCASSLFKGSTGNSDSKRAQDLIFTKPNPSIEPNSSSRTSSKSSSLAITHHRHRHIEIDFCVSAKQNAKHLQISDGHFCIDLDTVLQLVRQAHSDALSQFDDLRTDGCFGRFIGCRSNGDGDTRSE